MFKHTVNYVDFNGAERTEELYFHLSLPEVTRLQAEIGGRELEDYIKEIVNNQDLNTLLSFLEKILLNSYGKKTPDGKSFHKTPELRREFENSQAYAEIFEDFFNDQDLARKFGEQVSAKSEKRKNQFDPQVVSKPSVQE